MATRGRVLRRLLTATAAAAGGAGAYCLATRSDAPPSAPVSAARRDAALGWRPEGRAATMAALRESAAAPFDVIVVGGGATGTGCALDAASRGLRVALVERDDFASGTSSKSTKLVHGGVRYLEKAFRTLDWAQFAMVREALCERARLLRNAPHLTEEVPILLPVYSRLMLPYYWAGSKAYDAVAGSRGLAPSSYVSAAAARRLFPMLPAAGLVGGIVYYDGGQNDARTNVALALTAASHGAVVANYVAVDDLIKGGGGGGGEITGVRVTDRITGETFAVSGRCVISATGPFCDALRAKDSPAARAAVQPSVGTHIVLPSYYCPHSVGLIDPASSDGRIIFFLPFQGHTIAGTTDAPSPITDAPTPPGDDVDFLLGEVRRYLSPLLGVTKGDITAAWAGFRPLVRDPTASTRTEALVRSHIIIESAAGLVTVTGGKWTTYRQMAEDAIDHVIARFDLRPKHSTTAVTADLPLIGAHGYGPDTHIRLMRAFALEPDVAGHLAKSYGDRAHLVAAIAACAPAVGRCGDGAPARLAPGLPYLEGEVIYAVHYEYALRAVDVLARRTRLAHVSVAKALDALPRVVELMGRELGWCAAEQARQTQIAIEYFEQCGSAVLPLEPIGAFASRGHQRARRLALLGEAFCPAGHGGRWRRLSVDEACAAIRALIAAPDFGFIFARSTAPTDSTRPIDAATIDWGAVECILQRDGAAAGVAFDTFVEAIGHIAAAH